MNAQSVHLVRVNVGQRRRKVDRAKVKGLADSIVEIGLLNPITVREIGDEYALVAGRHRLEAAKMLGWSQIPAVIVELGDVDRLLAEIDENLIRNDLSDLERAEHLAERKRLYLLKHPETKRGTAGANAKHGSASEMISFAADTSAKTGRTERAVQQDVQIAESIPEDVRDAIRETPLADSKTALLEMARLTEEAQRKLVASIDLADRRAVRAAVDEARGFTCRTCGEEQTMRVWHCDGCGEHWLPGDACQECASNPSRHEDDEDCDAPITRVEVAPTVAAFVAAIRELFTPDERAAIVAAIGGAA